MKTFVFCAVLVIAIFCGPPAYAQDEISASLTPAQTELTVGDVVTLTLSVSHPAGYQLVPLDLPEQWGSFEVRQIGAVEMVPNEGVETSSQIIAVTLWAPGEYLTPSLEAQISAPQGNPETITVDPIKLNVVSVLEAEDTELRDIKPQAELPIPPVWPWILGGLLLAAGLVAALMKWYERWEARQVEQTLQVRDPRPANQIALEELDRIAALNLPEQGRFKAHYTLVTDTLRLYLETTRQVPALDQTTSEIHQAARSSNLKVEDRLQLLKLLREADLVKFAKVTPEIARAEELIDEAREWVSATWVDPVEPLMPDERETTST